MTKTVCCDPRWRTATNLVRGGLTRSEFNETSEALYMSSGYVYESAEEAEAAFAGDKDRYIYSRYANPTLSMLEERLALLEGAEACATTASGMAAVFAALACQVEAGDYVVASRALFGSCLYIVTDILPRLGVETRVVDGTNLAEWEEALSRKTKCVFLETPTNPTLEIIDLAAVSALAHKAGARVIVDNVFSTPMLQRPLQLGADIVVYSTTKHIDGQGRALGGAILCDKEFHKEFVTPFMRHTGPAMSPFNAWICLKGLETLDLRVRQHCQNTLQIARFLEAQETLDRVIYPGLESHPQHELCKRQMSGASTVVSFELNGGKETAFKFLNALEIIDLSNNLGDAKSLITHPQTTTHQRLSDEEREQLGIGGGLVRLSVGLEDPLDLQDDLGRALDFAQL
ncbi:MAG: O-succinylhomoserine sulfhydrylase [Rhodospirillaceae bacterium]|nr:O-succinylhomoserine sulfhydrylase [Rhodospirillaceae bacterium]MDD9925707.1 O-succinylhomoserine sulfhydrylase [Rhodospirillaceae bacterium]